ncbi:MAG: hypothetical protein WDM80_12005 [Limisphaerales bacterium]
MDLPSSQTAVAFLKKVSPLRPTLAIVLGSGFHHALTELRVDKKISYAKIPRLSQSGPSAVTRGNCISAISARRRCWF